jgi:hypothetical protein
MFFIARGHVFRSLSSARRALDNIAQPRVCIWLAPCRANRARARRRARSRSLIVIGMNRPTWGKRVNEVSPATSLVHAHLSRTRTKDDSGGTYAKHIPGFTLGEARGPGAGRAKLRLRRGFPVDLA